MGSPIIARNYMKLSQSRLEGLLSAFPRLIKSGQQHSYVENSEARFVFQSVDQLYLVLITTKSSNLLQEMETLHLAGRILSSTCSSIDEAAIMENYSEILFAWDEVVSIGLSEATTLPSVNTILAMESKEEELQELIEKNKIQEAKEISKMKMKQLEQEKRESRRRASHGFSGHGANSSPIGQSSMMPSASFDSVRVQTEAIEFSPKSKPSRLASVAGKGMSLKKY